MASVECRSSFEQFELHYHQQVGHNECKHLESVGILIKIAFSVIFCRALLLETSRPGLSFFSLLLAGDRWDRDKTYYAVVAPSPYRVKGFEINIQDPKRCAFEATALVQ